MEGTFKAIGSEVLRPSNPLVILPGVGFIQLIALLELNIQAKIDFLFVSFPFIGRPFGLSLGIAVVSILVLVYVRISYYRAGSMTIHYTDDRASGGTLNISYETSQGKHRRSLVVKEIKATPDLPLTQAELRLETTVKGTKSSMRIIFLKPKMSLDVGFPSKDEMNEIYDRLK